MASTNSHNSFLLQIVLFFNTEQDWNYGFNFFIFSFLRWCTPEQCRRVGIGPGHQTSQAIYAFLQGMDHSYLPAQHHCQDHDVVLQLKQGSKEDPEHCPNGKKMKIFKLHACAVQGRRQPSLCRDRFSEVKAVDGVQTHWICELNTRLTFFPFSLGGHIQLGVCVAATCKKIYINIYMQNYYPNKGTGIICRLRIYCAQMSKFY